nr:hypothetical protein [Tanacetum cinerariifolium]
MANTTVGIGVGPAVRPQPVPTGKPKVRPVPTGKPKVKPVSTGKPKVTPVPTGKPKVTLVPTGKPQVSTPVLTGRPNRPFPVPTNIGFSPLVISGWWVFNSPMLYLLRVEMVINSPWIMPILGTKELASPEQTAPDFSRILFKNQASRFKTEGLSGNWKLT